MENESSQNLKQFNSRYRQHIQVLEATLNVNISYVQAQGGGSKLVQQRIGENILFIIVRRMYLAEQSDDEDEWESPT